MAEVLIGEPGDHLRAVSIHYLRSTFLSEVIDCGLTREARIYEIEPKVIRGKGELVTCPRDRRLGAAYVDAVEGLENVGRATHMLSYTWGYQIGDIVDALEDWCGMQTLAPQEVKVWMCCLCINQHRVIEAKSDGRIVTFDDFRDEFESRVRLIGHVLALMEPWQKPRYTTRVWCVFELYTALQNETCELQIIMPPRDALGFRQALSQGDGLEMLWKALTSIDVEKAEASVPADRERILDLVAKGPGSGKLNRLTIEKLQAWFAETSEMYLKMMLARGERNRRIAQACVHNGDMLRQIGQGSRAMGILQEARSIYEQLSLMLTFDAAVLLRIEATAFRQSNEFAIAKKCCIEAEKILMRIGHLETEEGADLMQTMGKVYGDECKLEREMGYHERALKIRKKIGTLHTHKGAALMRSIGMVHSQQGEHDAALRCFETARMCHERSRSLVTPDGAALLQSIGDVLLNEALATSQDKEHALRAYREALYITERTGTSDTRGGMRLAEKLKFHWPPDQATPLPISTADSTTEIATDSAASGGHVVPVLSGPAMLAAPPASCSKLEREVHRRFAEADHNGDGFLTETELESIMTKLGLEPGKVKKLLAAADKDADGRLNMSEFLGWVFSGSKAAQSVRKELS